MDTSRKLPSPWLGIPPGGDANRLARALRQAHDLTLRDGKMPKVLRSIVASSWRRACEAGIDPDARAPLSVDPAIVRRALDANPIAGALRRFEHAIAEATASANGFAALTDRDGLLLWVDGSPRGLESAAAAGFVPGHLCSEDAVGTNAVGTALRIGHAVQIFSAEHFSRRLHGLTCVAAPIKNPTTGETIAVLDLSSGFQAGHPHSLSLVTALAAAMETEVADVDRQRADGQRAAYIELVARGGYERSALVSLAGAVIASSPRGWLGKRLELGADGALKVPANVSVESDRIAGAYVVRIDGEAAEVEPELLSIRIDHGRAQARIGAWATQLSRRHGEILVALALHPAGLTGEELRDALRDSDRKPVTLRAEIFRLRSLLGPVIASSPYCITCPTEFDRGELVAAMGSWTD
jgi:GAF domain-containing protein